MNRLIIILGLLLSGAGQAADLQPDSSVVATGQFDYRTILKVGDTRMDIDSVRHIRVARAASPQILKIRTVTRTEMGSTEDRLELDFETMMPIERKVRQEGGRMQVNYRPDQVTGTIQAAGQIVAVDLALDEPAYAGESGLEALLTAMPLSGGEEYKLRIIEIDVETVVRTFRIRVGDLESVEVPAGRFDAWPVHLKSTDKYRDEQTIWISDDSPRIFVQAMAPVPADLGDGSLTTELISIGN
ncbi:DUF3108 domain-containing protein [Wenzhouxiangella sp. AB-CW3]|uniref:DUF3108 domain-containing protein n=1 Tax=Wenzhouxiangella sp. AB-CW3 TaxID=2771012 RepID=UPI00168AA699|nr:DUF3108 domain-containing protein [Wenzhouxiangella sp. AB-CW3]QOC23952.1 DUF3108 domain-containing protein [Wenzhouxiangella sp. AB-CW3]